MREILFRGKRVNNGEWVEGGIIPLDVDSGYVFIAEPYLSASTLPVYEIVKNHTHLVKPESVGQYTGLTDKNGKKIFEGDIVNEYDMPEKISNTGIVQWSNVFMGWHISKTRSMYCHEFMTYEVIGNIHDNPELLGTPQNDEVRE